jgi:hypothetical protein
MWNPPTGPPNDVPLRPADVRREIAQAVDAARARDRELRAHVAVLARRGIEAAGEVEDATGDAAEARKLAKRALQRADESARAGQRADATRWIGAARVFALRLLDARARVAALEAELPAIAARRQAVESAMAANVGRLTQVAVARRASLSARKAAKLQASVDEACAELSAPIDGAVAAAERDARTAREEAAAGVGAGAVEGETEEVGVDDLEQEVDLDAADPVLDELRAELGLDEAPPPEPEPESASEPEAEAESPAESSPEPEAEPASEPAGSR